MPQQFPPIYSSSLFFGWIVYMIKLYIIIIIIIIIPLSLFRSKAQLSYEDAQKVIDGDHLDPSNFHVTEIEQAIRDLMGLAQHMRDRRFASGGALAINTLKLEFELNKETREPVSVTSYEHLDAHHLIEEFMLQANLSVSKIISKAYPNDALLRRHRGPIIRRMVEIICFAPISLYEL